MFERFHAERSDSIRTLLVQFNRPDESRFLKAHNPPPFFNLHSSFPPPPAAGRISKPVAKLTRPDSETCIREEAIPLGSGFAGLGLLTRHPPRF